MAPAASGKGAWLLVTLAVLLGGIVLGGFLLYPRATRLQPAPAPGFTTGPKPTSSELAAHLPPALPIEPELAPLPRVAEPISKKEVRPPKPEPVAVEPPKNNPWNPIPAKAPRPVVLDPREAPDRKLTMKVDNPLGTITIPDLNGKEQVTLVGWAKVLRSARSTIRQSSTRPLWLKRSLSPATSTGIRSRSERARREGYGRWTRPRHRAADSERAGRRSLGRGKIRSDRRNRNGTRHRAPRRLRRARERKRTRRDHTLLGRVSQGRVHGRRRECGLQEIGRGRPGADNRHRRVAKWDKVIASAMRTSFTSLPSQLFRLLELRRDFAVQIHHHSFTIHALVTRRIDRQSN